MSLRARLARLEAYHAPVPLVACVLQRGKGGLACVTVAGEHFARFEDYRRRYPPNRIALERWTILHFDDDDEATPSAPNSLAGCCWRETATREGA